MVKSFTPQQVGEVCDQTKHNITKAYEALTDRLTLITSYLYDTFGQASPGEIFELIQSPFAEKLLVLKYANARQDEFGELKLQELIDKKLVDLPEPLKFILDELQNIEEDFSATKDHNFFFPLVHLFADDGNGAPRFELNEDFLEALTDRLTYKTQSHMQNKILDSFESIRDGLNSLHEKGIINLRTHGPGHLGNLGVYFERSRNNDPLAPLDVKPNLFRIQKVRKFWVGENRRQIEFKEMFSLNGYATGDEPGQ